MRIILPKPEDTYLCSDFHAYHKNAAKGSSSWPDGGMRDFDDEFQMTDQLVENINSVVKRNDWLIHLGDWAFGGATKVAEFRSRIRCRNIINVFGNHDQAGDFQWSNKSRQWRRKKWSRFTSDLFTLTADYLEFRYHKLLFCCCHYPITSWNEMGHGSVMVYGHSHSNLEKKYCHGRMIDVGVDNPELNFSPISLPDLFDRMSKVPIKTVDHHDSIL